MGLSLSVRLRLVAALACATLSAACGGPGSDTSRTAPQVASAPRPATISGNGLGAPVRGDAQVLGVLAAFEQNEIDLAQQAIARGVGGDSEAFAQEMLRDHQRGLAGARERGAEDSEQARALRARGQATTASAALEDDSQRYRNAFLKAATADYGDALKLMDAEWLPAAQDADTRRYLEGVRKRLAHAFERAQSAVSTQ